jgi:intracellular sulfur oxidation DsrE/DsrF family protein
MKFNIHRRQFLHWLIVASGLLTLSFNGQAEPIDRDLFGEPEHKLVYQLNKADTDYIEHILFSIGAMLRKYSDDIHIVVVAIGPGIHTLANKPQRPLPALAQERIESLAAYGVSFHACGNTMKSLDWSEKDMLDIAEIVEIGADDLMLLQEQGYSYISW